MPPPQKVLRDSFEAENLHDVETTAEGHGQFKPSNDITQNCIWQPIGLARAPIITKSASAGRRAGFFSSVMLGIDSKWSVHVRR